MVLMLKSLQELLKKKSKLHENNMEHLLSRRFNTKKSIQKQLSSIQDFPKLTLKEIQNEILFGSFQLKQSRSYIGDMINNGNVFIIEDSQSKTRKEENDSVLKCKLLGFEINSRHKRSEKKDNKRREMKKFRITYKVIIKYFRNENNSEAIKGNKKFKFLLYLLKLISFGILSLHLQLHVREKNGRLLCSCCFRYIFSKFCKICWL